MLMVVEAAADARTIAALVDKVLLESESRPAWLELEHIAYMREWVDLDDDAPLSGTSRHLTWTDMKNRGPRVLGHGKEGPTRNPYAKAARRAIAACELAATAPNSIVLVVDADAQGDRRAGLLEGRETQPSQLRVVVGAADPKREAWILNAFVPDNDEERGRLTRLRTALTFDPCSEAHRLRDKRGELRDIKRVLAVLVDNDRERELDAVQRAPLADLAKTGERTGLSAFLRDASSLMDALTDESLCASVTDE